MRLMSFALTTEQVLARTKTETRRLGWTSAKVGQRIVAVEKAQGLRPGGVVHPLAVIEIVEVKREPLWNIHPRAVKREGFPDMTPGEFVEMFCEHMRCHAGDLVTVLRFRYVHERDMTEHEYAQWCRLVQRNTTSTRNTASTSKEQT